MKKIISLVLMVAMLATSVMATETTLTPDVLTMDLVDSKTVTYCISEEGIPQDVGVQVTAMCQELNNQVGCTAGDDNGVDEAGKFDVVPNELTTGADGCVDLTVTTNLLSGEEGKFRYAVDGKVGETLIGAAENGLVYVPEFGVVAAGLALAGAGVYIAKRRKK